jgi:hypothetical protein
LEGGERQEYLTPCCLASPRFEEDGGDDNDDNGCYYIIVIIIIYTTTITITITIKSYRNLNSRITFIEKSVLYL